MGCGMLPCCTLEMEDVGKAKEFLQTIADQDKPPFNEKAKDILMNF